MGFGELVHGSSNVSGSPDFPNEATFKNLDSG